jgi:hypothetical protein
MLKAGQVADKDVHYTVRILWGFLVNGYPILIDRLYRCPLLMLPRQQKRPSLRDDLVR